MSFKTSRADNLQPMRTAFPGKVLLLLLMAALFLFPSCDKEKKPEKVKPSKKPLITGSKAYSTRFDFKRGVEYNYVIELTGDSKTTYGKPGDKDLTYNETLSEKSLLTFKGTRKGEARVTTAVRDRKKGSEPLTVDSVSGALVDNMIRIKGEATEGERFHLLKLFHFPSDKKKAGETWETSTLDDEGNGYYVRSHIKGTKKKGKKEYLVIDSEFVYGKKKNKSSLKFVGRGLSLYDPHKKVLYRENLRYKLDVLFVKADGNWVKVKQTGKIILNLQGKGKRKDENS